MGKGALRQMGGDDDDSSSGFVILFLLLVFGLLGLHFEQY